MGFGKTYTTTISKVIEANWNGGQIINKFNRQNGNIRPYLESFVNINKSSQTFQIPTLLAILNII